MSNQKSYLENIQQIELSRVDPIDFFRSSGKGLKARKKSSWSEKFSGTICLRKLFFPAEALREHNWNV